MGPTGCDPWMYRAFSLTWPASMLIYCVRKEFNSHRIVLVHQHGRRDVKCKRSIVSGSIKENILFWCLLFGVIYHLLTEYLTQVLHSYGGILIRFKKNNSWHIFCIMWVGILKKKEIQYEAQYIKAWSKYLGEKCFAWGKGLFHTGLFLGTNMADVCQHGLRNFIWKRSMAWFSFEVRSHWLEL